MNTNERFKDYIKNVNRNAKRIARNDVKNIKHELNNISQMKIPVHEKVLMFGKIHKNLSSYKKGKLRTSHFGNETTASVSAATTAAQTIAATTAAATTAATTSAVAAATAAATVPVGDAAIKVSLGGEPTYNDLIGAAAQLIDTAAATVAPEQSNLPAGNDITTDTAAVQENAAITGVEFGYKRKYKRKY
jgi:hypothetical protein